jgi:hypothetical protein
MAADFQKKARGYEVDLGLEKHSFLELMLDWTVNDRHIVTVRRVQSHVKSTPYMHQQTFTNPACLKLAPH